MKAKKLACLATAAVLTASMAAIFAGCGGGDKVTVTWWDLRTELKSEEVDKGSTVPEYTPTKDGYIFLNWSSDSSANVKWDPETKIEEDTDLYAVWGNANVESDTRMWYILGAGAGDLIDNNFAFATEPKRTPLVADTDENGDPILDENDDPVMVGGDVILDDAGYAEFEVVEGMDKFLLEKADDANDYSIEVTLYKGAEFQMATNMTNSAAWTGDAGCARAGFGNMVGAEYLTTTTGQILDEDENVIFTGKKGFDATWLNWNITSNINAKFKFTLHTFPGEDAERNTIDWEIVEDLGEIEVNHELYLAGTYNNFTDEERYMLVPDATGKVFTGYLNVPADGYALKVHDGKQGASSGWYTLGDDFDTDNDGNSVLTEGYYKITVTYGDAVEPTIEVEAQDQVFDYYVVGTFEDLNFANGTILRRMHAVNAATVAFTFEVTDATAGSYSWVGDSSSGGVDGAIFAVRIVSGKANKVPNNGTINWIGAGNEFLTEEGIYTATYNIASGEIAFTKVGEIGDEIELDVLADPDDYEVDETPLDYFVVGTFTDLDHANAPVPDSHKMTKIDDDTYTFELVVTDITEQYDWLKGGIFQIQVIAAEQGVEEVSNAAGTAKWDQANTYTFTEEGTYIVTFKLSEKTLTAEKQS